MRVSNFLLWQIAYAEIWVTDTLWPDFRRRASARGDRRLPEARSPLRRHQAVAGGDSAPSDDAVLERRASCSYWSAIGASGAAPPAGSAPSRWSSLADLLALREYRGAGRRRSALAARRAVAAARRDAVLCRRRVAGARRSRWSTGRRPRVPAMIGVVDRAVALSRSRAGRRRPTRWPRVGVAGLPRALPRPADRRDGRDARDAPDARRCSC